MVEHIEGDRHRAALDHIEYVLIVHVRGNEVVPKAQSPFVIVLDEAVECAQLFRGLLSTVQCLSFHGIKLVPAPDGAHEFGVGGTPLGPEGRGAQPFVGAADDAGGGCCPKEL